MPKRKVQEAAALRYGIGDDAPVITALGRGLVAEKIVEKARESSVPVVSDSLLAHALTQLNLGDEIPKEFYAIVAQVLVMVSRMDDAYGQKKT
jgi:flagellar biosynthesis protein